MVQVFTDDESKKKSNEEKAKTLVNLITIMTVGFFVAMAVFLYLSFVLNWDPAIAIIPVLVVMIPAVSYLVWKILEISVDAEKLPEQTSAPPSQPASPGKVPPFAEDGKKTKNEEKKRAIRNLVLVVAIVDMAAVAVYVYCIFGLGWVPDKIYKPVLGVFFIPSGLYFAWKMEKIKTGS